MTETSPRVYAARLLALTQEFSKDSEELGRLRAQKAISWLTLRKTAKTDKECDRALEATPDGQREIMLTFKCRGMEKEISALKVQLRLLDSEARGIF